MYQLRGLKEMSPLGVVISEGSDLIARFTTFKAACDYVEASDLGITGNERYRKDSLLYGYQGVIIEDEEPRDIVPVDPTLR
jgi:hypothetical protein